MKNAKANFYNDTVADLKLKKPGQWYTCLKKISSSDQNQKWTIKCCWVEPSTWSRAGSIQNLYETLKTEDISVPPFVDSDIPQFHPAQVWFVLSRINTSKATVPGDLPARLIKQFAVYLEEPVSDIFNTSMKRGNTNIYTNLKFVPLFRNPIPQRILHNWETLVGY